MYTVFRRAGLFILATFLMGSTALAQAPDVSAQDVSPDEIERVAEVLLDIDEVRTAYQEKIRASDKPKQVRAYQRQLKMEIDQTIEEADGLTKERYDEITQAAQSDDELKQNILSTVKEKRKKRASR